MSFYFSTYLLAYSFVIFYSYRTRHDNQYEEVCKRSILTL